MTAIADVAVEYAAGGALVLPLHSPDADQVGGCSCRRRDCGDHAGKHPRTLNGLHDATADIETVARWWSMWPLANIGIRPHPGQLVLDIDPRSGGAVQAVAMQNRYGRLPRTRTAVTGGGGWHLWWRHDGEVLGKIAPGLDIKDHGGFLVAAPSIHRSGARYGWTDTGPIEPAPDFLVRVMSRVPVSRGPITGEVTEGRLQGLVRHVASAQPGTRNGALYWAACRLHEAGADVAPLVAAAVTAGLSPREAERTVASASAAPRSGDGR